MKNIKTINAALIVLGSCILVTLPLWNIFPAESWHDTQRYGQIFLFAISIILLNINTFCKISFLKKKEILLLVFLFFLAYISSIFSKKPMWAFAELSILICSLVLAKNLIFFRNSYKNIFDNYFIILIFVICGLLIFKFLLNYLFLENDWNKLNLWMLIPGFDNPRFFGQFSTLVLPILSVPILVSHSKKNIQFSLFVTTLWWLMIITSGTRGTWAGLLGISIFVALLVKTGCRFAKVQFFCVITASILYVILFKVIPFFTGLEIENAAEGRLNYGLSAREIIWKQAFQMAIEKPWFGYGPMHFSDNSKPDAAHPHQMILQFSSEFGMPFTIILMIFIAYIFWNIFKKIKKITNYNNKSEILYVCLTISIGGSFLQSMVDGVFVMPYTELWFTICAAWLFSIHRGNFSMDASALKYPFLMIGVISISLLIFIAFRDHPSTWNEYIAYKKNVEERFLPRFWVQGIINENY